MIVKLSQVQVATWWYNVPGISYKTFCYPFERGRDFYEQSTTRLTKNIKKFYYTEPYTQDFFLRISRLGPIS
jgi:hypothetical protein